MNDKYLNLFRLVEDPFWRYPSIASFMIEARNVVNVDEVEQYVKGLEPAVEDNAEIKKWLSSNLRNFLIRDYDKVELVKRIHPDSPDWLKKMGYEGLDKANETDKDKIVQVNITPDFKDKIQHALDYLKSPEAPKKLDRLTVPEAIKQSDAWTKKLTKKKFDKAVAEQGEQIVKDYGDGFSWRRLVSQDALTREGNLMGHCVGRYWEAVKNHSIEIWSLRDAKNEPHVTLELKNEQHHVAQIKGKQNQAVVKQYRKYIKDIMNEYMPGWEVSETEVKNCDLFKKFGKWWTDESQFAEDEELFGNMVRAFFRDWNKFSIPPKPNPEGAWMVFTLEQFLEYMATQPRDSRPSLKTYQALLVYDPDINDEDPNMLLNPDDPVQSKAIHEGWKVGTQKAAREYAIKNLNRIAWVGGSNTATPDSEDTEGGVIGLQVSWEALENGHLGDIRRGRNPQKSGWEATYDQQAAEEYLVKHKK